MSHIGCQDGALNALALCARSHSRVAAHSGGGFIYPTVPSPRRLPAAMVWKSSKMSQGRSRRQSYLPKMKRIAVNMRKPPE
jgi:hypothetical protein